MKRNIRLFLCTLPLILFFVTGCISAKPEEALPPPDPIHNAQGKLPGQVPADPIREKIGAMTIDEKIGQMVIAGLDGYDIDAYSKELIEKYKVGGFIFFGRNIKDPKQTITLLNSLKETNSDLELPLFLAVDEEGGAVNRLPQEVRKFPSNRAIGQIESEQFSYEAGRETARQLKSFGFNLNFAPVLDINSNPNNPVIGDRSFGSGADIVSKLGLSAMKGLQSEEVISVVKHFPGHGDTSVDSHVGLPVVQHDMERLKKLELVPFARAVRDDADAVMVAHILLPKLDPDYPSSMSEPIMTGLLRNELNFDGVIFTDDMTMGAIVKRYDIGQSAVRSVNAGSDIVLVCHDFAKQTAVIQALKQSVKEGKLTEERIDGSVYRIIRLKEKYKLTDKKIGAVDVAKINKDVDEVLQIFKKMTERTKGCERGADGKDDIRNKI
ncbi:beta-N-acetylhexosaminidase [Paenibacillus alkalitolerans]|uniref:beta-N-acetylhexosaminidase n=1 Tax=Paenibacillus alkalitolerans TaxID=2799335 RepID=UPI0018F6CDF2|nr:beta-N-acetylhexosaminidase [Paenibacillus alkalitolerans]